MCLLNRHLDNIWVKINTRIAGIGCVEGLHNFNIVLSLFGGGQIFSLGSAELVNVCSDITLDLLLEVDKRLSTFSPSSLAKRQGIIAVFAHIHGLLTCWISLPSGEKYGVRHLKIIFFL